MARPVIPVLFLEFDATQIYMFLCMNAVYRRNSTRTALVVFLSSALKICGVMNFIFWNVIRKWMYHGFRENFSPRVVEYNELINVFR
jgi:hypothetical protein